MKIWQKQIHIILWEKPTESQQVQDPAGGTVPSRGHRDHPPHPTPSKQVLVWPCVWDVDTEAQSLNSLLRSDSE